MSAHLLPVDPPAIAAEFQKRLAASLEMLCGETVDVEEAPLPADATLIWRRHPLATDPASELYTAAPEIIGRAIGARVLSAAGLDDFTDEDVAGSYTEVMQSALSAVAQFVGRAVGLDIGIGEGVPSIPESSPAVEVCYHLRFGPQILAPLCFGIPQTMLQFLESRVLKEDPATPLSGRAAQLPLQQPSVPPSESLPGPGCVTGDLSRVLDLELPIRVSFGKANVPLRDVLKLSTGSIVELDRSIHDPVEIIVNDRVVGRGEVVVVEGNYGVRIQEIVSLGPG